MADKLDYLRGLIIAEAKRRKSRIRFQSNGRPHLGDLMAETGISEATLSRIITGGIEQRKTTESPRRDYYEPSPRVQDKLQEWLHLYTREDLWSAINSAHPLPPFPKRGA